MRDLATHKGTLSVLSGPSGVGKSTIIARLLEDERYALSISATTRSPRQGEVDGVHYYFLSEEEFEARVQEGAFLEHAMVHGHRYGTLEAEVVRLLDAGQWVILDIDVQGFLDLETALPSTSIFVAPPSFDVLEKRLRSRDTEDEETIQRRLATARWELEQKDKYDHVVVNDDLDRTIQTIDQILSREHGSIDPAERGNRHD